VAVTNTLAYYRTELITDVEAFMIQVSSLHIGHLSGLPTYNIYYTMVEVRASVKQYISLLQLGTNNSCKKVL
jgi:hypothetical protein